MVMVAMYLCAFHAASEEAVWTILAAAFIAELMPRRLRQYLVSEVLLILSGCISYWWLIPPGNQEMCIRDSPCRRRICGRRPWR